MSPGDLFLLPAALPVLLLVPLLWSVLRSADRARARELAELVGPRTSVLAGELRRGERRFRRWLAVGGLALALIAVLQPCWGEGVRKVEQRGVDVLICLDVSRSMLARDLVPSRLERARNEIKALAEHVEGDRLGLVAFAGEARLVSPLTRDMEAFAHLVDLSGPLSVERGGTDLGAALEVAMKALTGASGEHELVLLLTDGEDLAGRGRAMAEALGQRDVRLHGVGFASEAGGRIPVATAGGESTLRDRSGEEVVTALDGEGLREIAELTGGTFVAATIGPAPLVGLYEKRVRPMARKTYGAEDRAERPNRYQWPLLAAILLWTLEMCLTDRRRR